MLAPLSLPWPPKRTHRWHPEDAKTALGYSRNSRRSTRQSYCHASIRFPIPTAKPRESERAAPTLAAPLTICTPPGRASKRRSRRPDSGSFSAEIDEPGLLVGSQSAALTVGSLVPLASIDAQTRGWSDASSREKRRSTDQDFAREEGKGDGFCKEMTAAKTPLGLLSGSLVRASILFSGLAADGSGDSGNGRILTLQIAMAGGGRGKLCR